MEKMKTRGREWQWSRERAARRHPGTDVVHSKGKVGDVECGEGGCSLLVFCDECRMAGSGFGGRGGEKKRWRSTPLTVSPCCAVLTHWDWVCCPGRDTKWGISVRKPREAGRRTTKQAGRQSCFGPEMMRWTVVAVVVVVKIAGASRKRGTSGEEDDNRSGRRNEPVRWRQGLIGRLMVAGRRKSVEENQTVRCGLEKADVEKAGQGRHDPVAMLHRHTRTCSLHEHPSTPSSVH